jgi:hypothetical protein
MKKNILLFLTTAALIVLSSSIFAQTYVGSQVCAGCHNSVRATLGYNIVTEYTKTGHPYKLNSVTGTPPVYPTNTSPGVPNPPAGTSWNDFSYVIGGYGWKARFVRPNGLVYTETTTAQYNLADQSWVAYNLGQTTKYNYSCFQCHTTGASATGSWTGNPADSMGTFSEPGIRCEGCHGPGSNHIGNPTGIKPPNTDANLTYEVCGNCHQRGGRGNNIPSGSGYIQHHEQFNEMNASKHKDGNGAELTCGSCHDPHIALHYKDVAGNHSTSGEKLKGIRTVCQTCHPGKEIILKDGSGNTIGTKPIDCIDCHMSFTGKSAIATTVGNGFKGDLRTHIMAIDTRPYPRDSMFANNKVVLNGGLAKVTLDFVCLPCHSTKDLTWASQYAANIHTVGLTVPVELTTFEAKIQDKEIVLNWTTATEMNNQGFEIQRKYENNEFATIGLVKGHGTTTSPNQYSFVDRPAESGKYSYRLKQLDFDGKYEFSQVVEVNWDPVQSYNLAQNYPNPFNPTTTFKFGIMEKVNVKLSVLNLLGEEIAVLINEEKEAGNYTMVFNGVDLPSGVYYYQLKAGNFVDTKKMLLLK